MRPPGPHAPAADRRDLSLVLGSTFSVLSLVLLLTATPDGRDFFECPADAVDFTLCTPKAA